MTDHDRRATPCAAPAKSRPGRAHRQLEQSRTNRLARKSVLLALLLPPVLPVPQALQHRPIKSARRTRLRVSIRNDSEIWLRLGVEARPVFTYAAIRGAGCGRALYLFQRSLCEPAHRAESLFSATVHSSAARLHYCRRAAPRSAPGDSPLVPPYRDARAAQERVARGVVYCSRRYSVRARLNNSWIV